MATSLYLLGSGIQSPLHLTVETQQALRICRKVFVLHADPAVMRSIEALGPEVIDVADMYEGLTMRQAAYKAIADRVVSEAAAAPPVAFLVHGHPLFLVSASEYMLDLAQRQSVRTSVLPGISSFDTLMCDLGVDFGYGLQMFDTTTLLMHGWIPNPEVPMLLFQLATTMELRITKENRTGTALEPIVDLLAPLYGENHETYLISSASSILETADVTRIPLAALQSESIDLTGRPTLYVPAK
ncbi:SAM-dependent methyltransferase [Streptomyces sp. HUAS ZL42]|uniref:SAM-dependent methyltransferase n=1 Tax=Streptomyces sp. HUAS ZL42 TaxID=3231715 RepID=UPI00345EF257